MNQRRAASPEQAALADVLVQMARWDNEGGRPFTPSRVREGGRFRPSDIDRLFAIARVDPRERLADGRARRDALVDRLSAIDRAIQVALQADDYLPPAELAERFASIAAATGRALDALGASEAPMVRPEQVRDGLELAAESQRGRWSGYPRHDDSDLAAYNQMQDNLEALAQLRAWALEAEATAKAAVGKPDQSPHAPGVVIDAALTIARAAWTEIMGQTSGPAVFAPDKSAGEKTLTAGPILDFLAAVLAMFKIVGRDGAPLKPAGIKSRLYRLP